MNRRDSGTRVNDDPTSAVITPSVSRNLFQSAEDPDSTQPDGRLRASATASPSDSDDDATRERLNNSQFMPLHMQFSWPDPDSLADMHTVVLLLSDGVTKDMMGVEVVEDGRALEVLMEWPKQLSNSVVAHHKWLKEGSRCPLPAEHPRRVEYERALKHLRRTSKCKVRSVARFKLPFTVRKDVHEIHKVKVPYKDEVARLMFIDMKAVTSDYGKPGTGDFED